ncbi:MAG: PT domain-containing protein [Clostridia bacterium]|nr:PT domain-containing protein [Clostridia bacterium]
MKKALSVILALAVVFSLCSFFAFAEEPAEDPNTVVVPTYEGAHNPGNWLNQFDEEDVCFGNTYVAFRTAAPLKAIGFPEVYAGISDDDRDVDVKFEIFTYATDPATSVTGTAIFTKEVHFDGDVKEYNLELDTPLAAGQYVFKISQLSEKGSNPEAGHYFVLPSADMVYLNRHLVFGGTVGTEFAFSLIFEKTEGVTDYIVELDTGAQEAIFYDDRAVQVVKRVGDNARNFNSLDDYAILTAEIPEGKVLHQFILKNAPTWNNNGPGSDIDWEVYRWDNDYDTTFKGRAIAHGSEIDHKDNQDLVIDFGAKLKGGSRYLIVITASNDGAIGYWGGDTVSVEGWEFFENEGDDAQSYPACTYKTATYEGPEETEEPTPEETPTPEVTEAPATPTQAPTEPPTNTPEPAPTEEPTPEPKKSGCGNVIGGAFAIIAVAACALVIRKKH